jgi:hypothetical protein
VKLPPYIEEQALRAAAPAALGTAADAAAFVRLVRSGVPGWVRAMVMRAEAEMGGSAQRNAMASDREHTATALGVLQGRRELLVDRLVQAITRQLGEAERAGRAAQRPTAAADNAGALKLTLIDEAQIDEDIEISRIVQAIESGADGELQHLTALACGLHGLPGIDPGAAPLPPLACATGLRAGLVELVLDAGPRLLLLRQLGGALGHELGREYAKLSQALLGWGVVPASYRVKHSPAPRSAADTGKAAPAHEGATAAGTAGETAGASAGEEGAVASAALWRLVERARQSLAVAAPLAEAAGPAEAAEAAEADADDTLTLRLFSDPQPAARTRPALDPAAAVLLMERLCAQIEQHLGTTPGARAVLAGLQAPARALAAQETQIWSSPDHPWWQFLDRLIAVGSVHDDDGSAAAVTDSLAQVLERMRQAPTLDRAACQAAADDVQQVATRYLDERSSELLSQVGDIQTQADREDVEVELRNQIVQQLRSTPVCLGLRQFLVGPWTQAMAQVTLREGLNSATMGTLALVVDDLIRATASPGRAVSRAQRAVLLRQVGDGLAQAGFPPARADAELADLQVLLRDPPAAHEESWDEATHPAAHAAADHQATASMLELHAGLPTVPIGMGQGLDTPLEMVGQKPWLDALAPGAYCRLFLLGRWMTAQLSWVSDSHNLFLFSSRHGGRTHSLTRRMLGKLRNAGLATTIEDGFLLAQAMETLADTDFAAH